MNNTDEKTAFEKANDQFVYWKKLFETDREEFDRQRNKAIQDAIESAPEHRRDRLKSLQWKIDTTLNKIKNPTMRYLKMQDLFWEQTLKFNDFLQQLTGNKTSNNPLVVDDQLQPSATIIPFKNNKL